MKLFAQLTEAWGDRDTDVLRTRPRTRERKRTRSRTWKHYRGQTKTRERKTDGNKKRITYPLPAVQAWWWCAADVASSDRLDSFLRNCRLHKRMLSSKKWHKITGFVFLKKVGSREVYKASRQLHRCAWKLRAARAKSCLWFGCGGGKLTRLEQVPCDCTQN